MNEKRTIGRVGRTLVMQALYGVVVVTFAPIMNLIDTVIKEAYDANEANVNLTYVLPDKESTAILEEKKLAHYVKSRAVGVVQNKDVIDTILPHYLEKWSLSRVTRVDRQLLRLAFYELLYCTDVLNANEKVQLKPQSQIEQAERWKSIVINEVVEIAKTYSEEKSGKFINGVLGKASRDPFFKLRAKKIELERDLVDLERKLDHLLSNLKRVYRGETEHPNTHVLNDGTRDKLVVAVTTRLREQLQNDAEYALEEQLDKAITFALQTIRAPRKVIAVKEELEDFIVEQTRQFIFEQMLILVNEQLGQEPSNAQ